MADAVPHRRRAGRWVAAAVVAGLMTVGVVAVLLEVGGGVVVHTDRAEFDRTRQVLLGVRPGLDELTVSGGVSAGPAWVSSECPVDGDGPMGRGQPEAIRSWDLDESPDVASAGQDLERQLLAKGWRPRPGPADRVSHEFDRHHEGETLVADVFVFEGSGGDTSSRSSVSVSVRVDGASPCRYE
jgi:hypothetical protein